MKKYKIKNRLSKIMMVIMLLTLNFLGGTNSIYASNLLESRDANIYMVEDCGSLLTYKGVQVITKYVEYNEGGVTYPAYCMDKTKPGVGAVADNYNVSVQSAIQDVGLCKIITNGYPYKTIEELGVANRNEAFTATKQAVYCYIHGNKLEDYGAIGEAGQRTLNALINIVNNANNSTETKISSTISINRTSEKWEQDKMEKDYVSKTYSISAGAQIENYKIKITKENGEDLGGIKITDINNNERNEFSPNESFKVLIPIRIMKEKGTINLEVEAKVKTKPIFYGISEIIGCQDYALTTSSFEDGTGKIVDEYDKNETKIIILKKDQETNNPLEEVEFELLNQDLETVYTGLKTDKDGKITIDNLIPGLYYLNETKTLDGYELYTQLIKVELDLNQEATITVNNKKEEKPQIETRTKTSKEVKKLPVTGM